VTRGQGTTILNSRLATRLRSLRILLPIHFHITVYTHLGPHVEAYFHTAKFWRMHPYSNIALSVNGFFSLKGCVSVCLFWLSIIQSQQVRNRLPHESIYLLITRVLSLRNSIFLVSHLLIAETILEMHLAVRSIPGQQCQQLVHVERQLLHLPNKKKS